MKNFNSRSLLMVLIVSVMMSCQEKSAQNLTYSFEEITQSTNFQNYHAHMIEKKTLLDQYVKVTIDKNAEKQEILDQITQQTALSKDKLSLFQRVKSFLRKQQQDFTGVQSESAKKEIFQKISEFIQDQAVDQRLKENAIAFFKLEFENREGTLSQKIMEQFPQITDRSKLTELYVQYLHSLSGSKSTSF